MKIKKTTAFILSLVMLLTVLPVGISGGEKVNAETKTVGTFDQLESAVTNAKKNDRIVISTTGSIEFKHTIPVTTSVSIVGMAQNDFEKTKVVLSSPDEYESRHFEVKDIVENKDVILTIENLAINGSVPKRTGGIANGWGTVNMTDCIVNKNAGGYEGGGVYANYGTINNCQFTTNTTDGEGGAVSIGEVVINNSEFKNNSTKETRGNKGGAVFAGTVTMSGCTIENNSSIFGGGVAANIKSSLIDCKLKYNKATDHGGALYSREDMYLTNCELESNKAGIKGGAVKVERFGELYDCNFTRNTANTTASGDGGAINMFVGKLINCTLTNNYASQYGGAASAHIGQFTDCTFTGNESNKDGGAVNGDSVTFLSCTLSNNISKVKGCINANHFIEIYNSIIFKNNSSGKISVNSEGDLKIISSSIINNGENLDDKIYARRKINMAYSIIANSNKSQAVEVNSDNWPAIAPLEQKSHGTSGSTSEYCVAGESAGYTVNDLFGATPVLKNNGGYTRTLLPTEKARVIPVNSIKEKLPAIDQRGTARPTSGLACMGSVEIKMPQKADNSNDTKASNVTNIYSPNKNIYLKKGKSITLPVVASATDSKNPKLTWSTSNKKIATVNQSGKVTAKKKGKAKITVKAENNKSFTFTVNVVNKDKKVKKITVKGYKKSMKSGQHKYLKVILNPKTATNGKITFKSSNKSVITVDKAGKITALKKGKAKITVKAGGKKKVINITVK